VYGLKSLAVGDGGYGGLLALLAGVLAALTFVRR
jgi:hypothetical protein